MTADVRVAGWEVVVERDGVGTLVTRMEAGARSVFPSLFVFLTLKSRAATGQECPTRARQACSPSPSPSPPPHVRSLSPGVSPRAAGGRSRSNSSVSSEEESPRVSPVSSFASIVFPLISVTGAATAAAGPARERHGGRSGRGAALQPP